MKTKCVYVLFFIFLLMASGFTVFAQMPMQPSPVVGGMQPGQPGQPGPGPGLPPLEVLKAFFGFDAMQLTFVEKIYQDSIKNLMAAQIALQAAEKKQSEIMNAANPDATALGNSILAVRGARKTLEGVRITFGQEVAKLLTPSQKAKLEEAKALESILRTLPSLRGLGLL